MKQSTSREEKRRGIIRMETLKQDKVWSSHRMRNVGGEDGEDKQQLRNQIRQKGREERDRRQGEGEGKM